MLLVSRVCLYASMVALTLPAFPAAAQTSSSTKHSTARAKSRSATPHPAPAAPEPTAAPPPPKEAEAKAVQAKPAEAKPSEPELKVSVGGRIQLDTRYHSYPEDSFLGDESNLDWFEFRRVRLDAKAKYGKSLSGKVSVELTGTPYIKNAYIDTKLADSAIVELGKFTPSFNPEDVESSKYLTFLERSSIGKAVSSGDDHGVDLFGKTLGDYLVYHVGLVSGNVDQDTDTNNSVDGVARVIVEPTVDGDDFFKAWIGASVQAGKETTGDDEAIKVKPESGSGLSLFKASFDPGLDYDRVKFVLDTTLVVGPTTWRAEYLWAEYSFDQPATLSGGFLSGSVFLTGEQRTIESGYNERQEIDSPLHAGGAGAWELALRYSWFDVSEEFFADNGLFAGWKAVSPTKYASSGAAVTLGLNWYPNGYSRVMLNWVTTFAEHQAAGSTPASTESVTVENAVLARVQFEF